LHRKGTQRKTQGLRAISMEIKCPGCNKFIDAGSKLCPSCGRSMITAVSPEKSAGKGNNPPGQTPCPYCSEPIQKTAVKCKHCGEFVDGRSRVRAKGRKDKTVAGLLALFLGGIGIHKFYLDQPKTGLLYLLFCWFLFIPAIISFFEAIGIFMSSQEDFDRKYN